MIEMVDLQNVDLSELSKGDKVLYFDDSTHLIEIKEVWHKSKDSIDVKVVDKTGKQVLFDYSGQPIGTYKYGYDAFNGRICSLGDFNLTLLCFIQLCCKYYDFNLYHPDKLRLLEVKKDSRGNIKSEVFNPHFYAQWETGGLSGGNCWDDTEPSYYSTQENEPELKAIDELLTSFGLTPNFKVYKQLIREVVNYDEFREYEYYGNRTDYKSRTIYLKDLYDQLKEQTCVSM